MASEADDFLEGYSKNIIGNADRIGRWALALTTAYASYRAIDLSLNRDALFLSGAGYGGALSLFIIPRGVRAAVILPTNTSGQQG
jgi:hypothetical protein